MQVLGQLWIWITGPTSASLGPREWLIILAGVVVAFVGVFVAEASEARRRALVTRALRRRVSNANETGPVEYGLAADLRIKGGFGIAFGSIALILSILLRLLATTGLDTNILPTLVLVTVTGLLVFGIVYRLTRYPRYREMARRIDTRQVYEPTRSPSAKATSARRKATTPSRSAQNLPKPKIELMPGKALIGLASAPFIYYFLLIPHPSTMHDLHQIGMVIAALLGYLIGLALSLGDGVRTGSFWARRQHA